MIEAVVDKTEPWLSVWPTASRFCTLRTEKHRRKTRCYLIDSGVNTVFERAGIKCNGAAGKENTVWQLTFVDRYGCQAERELVCVANRSVDNLNRLVGSPEKPDLLGH